MTERKAHQVDSWLDNPDGGIRLVLIYGPDRGLVSERAIRFARSTRLPLDDAFTVIKLDASAIDDDPGRLIDEARTVSMFGGERLIWLRGSASQSALVGAVSDLLDAPPENTLVLIEAGDLKKSAKLRTVVEKSSSGITLPCYADDARAIDRLIDTQIASADTSITLEAREMLKKFLGGDRLASRNEIDKLLLYTDGQARIELPDVIESVGDASALSQEEVVDAVLGGNRARMDTAYSRMVRSGAPAFLSAVFTMRQFQSLQLMRAVMDRENKNAAATVASARPPVFFSRRALIEKSLGALNQAFICRALERLQQTVLHSRQYPDLATDLVRQALLALTLEIEASLRKR